MRAHDGDYMDDEAVEGQIEQRFLDLVGHPVTATPSSLTSHADDDELDELPF